MKTTFPHRPDETVFKPVGDLAQAIDAMLPRDFYLLMFGLMRQASAPFRPDPTIIIGKND